MAAAARWHAAESRHAAIVADVDDVCLCYTRHHTVHKHAAFDVLMVILHFFQFDMLFSMVSILSRRRRYFACQRMPRLILPFHASPFCVYFSHAMLICARCALRAYAHFSRRRGDFTAARELFFRAGAVPMPYACAAFMRDFTGKIKECAYFTTLAAYAMPGHARSYTLLCRATF